MLILSGANTVLPDGQTRECSIYVQGDRLVDVRPGQAPAGGPGDERLDLQGHTVVPGFIDVHLHGREGRDVLDGDDVVPMMAAHLAQHGVTSFSPTTVACTPAKLRSFFGVVREHRKNPAPGAARVLPAHLESNFISPDYKGAQPLEWICSPEGQPVPGATFGAAEILAEIDQARDEVGIVTMAPEIEGGINLVRRFVKAGIYVSLGHCGASYEKGMEAVEAGATHATHLFNRMPPLNHRKPGMMAAVIADDRVVTEIICDAHHVHPAMIRMVLKAKGVDGVMAITDAVSCAGLPEGSRADLGGHPITVRNGAAYLDDGTLAGSVISMDDAFRVLVNLVGVSLADAARLCSTTPARAMGLKDRGRIEKGLLADLAILDRDLKVAWTIVGGVKVKGCA